MDSATARLECLRLAQEHHATAVATTRDYSGEAVLTTAKSWATFVIGEPIKESAGTNKKGADEINPAPSHVP